MSHTLIIGGGVIGLSIAYELSRRQQRVTVIEKKKLGRAASWAGAGILPPTNGQTAIHPLEKLEALSSDLHRQWAVALKHQTNIDTGYTDCGGIYLARTAGEVAALTGQQLYWTEREIPFEVMTHEQLQQRVPGLIDSSTAANVRLALWLPTESQLRNPHHLQALIAACEKHLVNLITDAHEVSLNFNDGHTKSVYANGQTYTADHYCLAAGAWSEQLLGPLNISLPMTPVRGQMCLFQLPQPIFSPVINEGTRYLVPRADGHVLAGATIEEVGFNHDTDPADIAELVAWASSLIPACNQTTLIKSWSGLRPGTYDAFPYIGPLGNISNETKSSSQQYPHNNTWIATGHFKSGLHLSTGTAHLIADLIEDRPSAIALTPFAPNRISSLGIS